MAAVLITGAGSPLGQVLARNFAQKGWNLILHSFRSGDTVRSLQISLKNRYDIRVEHCVANFLDRSAIEQMIEHIQQMMIEPTVLVNNAAIFPSATPMLDMSQQQWQELWQLNVEAPLYLTRAFVRQLASSQGRIVNIASLGGIEIWRNRGIYNLTKNALIRMTQILAVELAPHFVVNAVAPGVITEPSQYGIEIDPRRIPMRRFGTPEDVWEAVYFFSTCSSYITGQVLVVDGGFHLAKGCV